MSPKAKGTKRRKLVKACDQVLDPGTQQDAHNAEIMDYYSPCSNSPRVKRTLNPRHCRDRSTTIRKEIDDAFNADDETTEDVVPRKNNAKRKEIESSDDNDNEGETLADRMQKAKAKQSKNKGECSKHSAQDDAGLKRKKVMDKGKAKMVDEEAEKAQPARRRCKEKEGFESIRHRGHLQMFVWVISKLDVSQRKVVEEAGFRRLLQMSSFEIPSFLCRWLVENYNARWGKIILPDKAELDVTKIDVEICLGIPRGPLEIIKLDSRCRLDVARKKHSITYEDAIKHMLLLKQEGDGFIREFIIYFHSCIIKPT